jgi:hypothetical protein
MCPDTVETVVEYRDTTIHDTIPGETITTIDSLYCDSLGNVYMIEIHKQENENMRLRRLLNNNRLITDCETDTVIREVYVKGIDKIVKETKKINVPFIPWWAKMLMFLGGVSIFSFIIVLLFKRYRK